ncbi:MAG: sodium/proline symporter [Gammaproteobacteria bacterium]|nr:sodium/proline symporter [Gammaproteobacteria bacterium]
MVAISLVFFCYLIVLFSVAFWTRYETRSLSGYFLADKKLPPWVVAFSTNATGESGWLLLGLTGMGYSAGVQAFWVVAGEVVGISLVWVFLARRVKRLGDESGSITVPDLLSATFTDPHNLIRKISVVIILAMVGAYVSAQMVATGKAFSTFTGMNYSLAVVFGATIIIAYTFIGGFKAVAYTDLVQGVLMLCGLILVPSVAISSLGGLQEMIVGLHNIDEHLLNLWRPQGGGQGGWILILSFLAVGLPFLGVPQLTVRFMSASSESSIRIAGTISIVVTFLFGTGAVLTGIAGRVLVPGLEDAETIFPVLASELFPDVITGLLMVVVLAAIMSTVDSLLLLASSAVVRDFLQKIRGSARSDTELARYGKITTLIIGVLGLSFALVESPLIFWFVLFAWSGLGAAFGPVLVCLFYYRGLTLHGAVASISGGFLTSVIWVASPLKSASGDLYEIIPGFVVGLILAVVVSRFTQTTNTLHP